LSNYASAGSYRTEFGLKSCTISRTNVISVATATDYTCKDGYIK